MAEVLDFGKAKRERDENELAYFVCDCGCRTFYVRNDCELECAYCFTIAQGAGSWRYPESKNGPQDMDANDPPERDIVDVSDPDLARRIVVSGAEDADVKGIVVLHENGRIQAWGDSHGDKKWRTWVGRKLREAAALMTERATDGI